MHRLILFLLCTAWIVLGLAVVASAQEFGGEVQYTTGDNPGDCFVGLLNNDSRQDIVVSNRNSNTVSVFMNRGNSAYYNKVDYAVGTYPSGVAGGDLDGDGDIDLAVSNRSSNNLSILLNAGSGTFSSATNYSVGTTPDAVFLADVDDDDDLDAIVANSGSASITVRYNNGSANFSSSSSFSTGAGTTPTALYAGRFSGYPYDPISIAVVSSNGNRVIIMDNNGYGSFWVGEVDTVGAIPIEIDGADIDDDGDIDLVVTAWKFATAISILTNDGGGFTDVAYTTLGGGADVDLCDVDNDSDPDIVAVSYTSVSIALNDGSGTFGACTWLDAPTGGWAAIVASDINDDSDIDLVAVSYNYDYLFVMRNKEVCCHGLAGNINWDPEDGVDISDLSVLVSYMFHGGPAPECMAEADINGDCGIDISDLTWLVDYMFQGGPEPAACGCGSPKMASTPPLPESFELAQNYPNPFNPVTTINYKVPVAGVVTLEIFNTLGQRVTTLVNDEVAAGLHSVEWNASVHPSGTYFYRLTSGNFTETKKMLLLK